jgi:hypothetical protein
LPSYWGRSLSLDISVKAKYLINPGIYRILAQSFAETLQHLRVNTTSFAVLPDQWGEG